MKCTECGKSLDQEYSFCPFCGAVIDKTQEEEAPIKEDRYDVVLTSLGKNPAEVIKPLASLFSCSVESVLEKTKHLPFVLAKDCDKEMAISVLIRWQKFFSLLCCSFVLTSLKWRWGSLHKTFSSFLPPNLYLTNIFNL